MRKSLIFITWPLFLTSCTYTINMVHSEGEASDVIDEQASATADIKPNVNIPASL